MPEHKSIHEAMLAIQSELTNPIKSAVNPHFKSKYATLPDIRDMITPILAEHGLFVMQPVQMGEMGAFLKTIITHAASGVKLTSAMPLMLEKQTPQGMGSAITYARRYALCSILNIAADEDDDGQAANGQKPKAKGDVTPENREGAADLWPVDQQEAWYKAAETLFSGESSVKALFAWEASNGNGKRFKAFHDEARSKSLWEKYVHALRIGAITDIENIDGLNELDAFWNENQRLLKIRLKDLFADVEQAKNTRKSQLNAGE